MGLKKKGRDCEVQISFPHDSVHFEVKLHIYLQSTTPVFMYKQSTNKSLTKRNCKHVNSVIPSFLIQKKKFQRSFSIYIYIYIFQIYLMQKNFRKSKYKMKKKNVY